LEDGFRWHLASGSRFIHNIHVTEGMLVWGLVLLLVLLLVLVGMAT
jgi:hypothetical protein